MSRILFDQPASVPLSSALADAPGHFIIGPRGHRGVRAAGRHVGQLVDKGAQTMWTDSADVGPRWRVRQSAGDMGPTALITAHTTGFHVEVDRFGTFPVHRLHNSEGEFLSDRVDLIGAATAVEVDEVSVAQIILFGHIYGLRSIVRGTHRNGPANIASERRRDGSPERVADALRATMAKLADAPIIVPLSGGNDSRGLLLAAVEAGLQDVFVFAAETGAGIDEPRIAVRVAHDLGIDIGIVRLTHSYLDDWFVPTAALCDYSDEQANPWSHTIAHGARWRPDGVLADGLGGDFLLQNKSGPAALDIALEFERGSADAARSFVEWRLGNRFVNLGWALPGDLAREAVQRAIADTAEFAERFGPGPSTFSLVFLAARSMPSVISQSLWWHPRVCFPYLAEPVWSAIEQVPLSRRFESDVFQNAVHKHLVHESSTWPSTSQSRATLLAQGLVDDSAAPRTAPRRLVNLRELAHQVFENRDFARTYERQPTAVQVRALCGLAVADIARRNFELHHQRRSTLRADDSRGVPTDQEFNRGGNGR